MANFKIPSWAKRWNRKIHIYLGLYMLFFLWLFSLSGLFLNHPEWFKPRAERSEYERAIEPPAAEGWQEKAESIARQLGLSGEIVLGPQQPRPDGFSFRVVRLNRLTGVQVDFKEKKAKLTVGTTGLLTFPVLERFHTLTGVRRVWGEPLEPKRDWVMTRIWSFSIDALAVGLMVMVLTSLYMWFQLTAKRRLGYVVLGAGVLVASYFMGGYSLFLG